ncbi:DUF128 domain-containing protein [Methanobrevibacter filiformis]|uniref:Ribonuclease R winged-helix domain protein n=1 Tax=Methanobrevibacter filiformis TaxID=55758 RepID=A0A165Z7B4_9EURY|nr:DUF128 domain-containing protein [Methanobrevibacter filiformis]KZX10342.1 ribonuclease R winged-helix domain protein [Methanobrevibacter filiformis]
MTESEHKMIEILRILEEHDKIIGSKIIADELNKKGFDLGERAVRYHMKILDEKGLTERVGYSGRKITALGKKELDKALVYDQVDFIFSKFEEMIYQTDFDYKTQKGNVIVNSSELQVEKGALDVIKEAFEAGLAVSPLVDMKQEKIDGKDILTMKTICGTTIDGMFLKEGIPSLPKYGGLLEVKNYHPIKFKELISYKQTSITPIEAFISDNMTSVLKIARTGNGMLPANLRIVPKVGKPQTLKILENLKKSKIGGTIAVGKSGEEVLGVPVPEDMFGIAIIGGIAPLCAAKESGHEVEIKLGEEIIPLNQLKPIVKSKETIKPDPQNKSHPKTKFVLTKAWNLMQKVNFNIETQRGDLITNISYLKKEDIPEAIEIMGQVYNDLDINTSPYYRIIETNDKNKIGIETICSLSVDGILINNGIMSTPKYGGLLELKPNPEFIELISYNGSSIDPHEIFIFKNMTSVSKVETGYNIVLASLKEVPNIARDKTKEILSKIEEIQLPIYKIGKPREFVYNAKVDNYNFGIITGGGLNPIAAIKEKGIDINIKAIEGIAKLSDMETL